MYLFYVVDSLDIKKIEKKNEYFGTKRFFPNYFPIITIFSSRRYYLNND